MAIVFTWVINNQGSLSKRSPGLAIFSMIGHYRPILEERIIPKTQQPYYAKGMWIDTGYLPLTAK